MTPESTPSQSESEPVNPMHILPGTCIGAYAIRKGIDRGWGGGQVAYLADGPEKGPVVIKLSRYPKGRQRTRARRMHERFIRQVAYFLELDDVPAVARVFGYGMYPDRSQSGHLYMVQEWVRGACNIVEWCRREPHPLGVILQGWMALAEACWRMEEKGICHRDLKAENVLMTERGIPKIIDLNTGLGRGAPRLTHESAGYAPGSLQCFSPELCEAILEEQATRQLIPFEFSPTGDLHSLGTIFYEVLTGEFPFDLSLKRAELFDEIAHDTPDRPADLNPEVPFGLQKVTLKLLEKKPEDRYQSGRDVLAELENLLANTKEDWKRPFQTPRLSRHSGFPETSSRPSSISTSPDEAGATEMQAAPAVQDPVPEPQGPIRLVDEAAPPSEKVPNAGGETGSAAQGDAVLSDAPGGDPPPPAIAGLGESVSCELRQPGEVRADLATAVPEGTPRLRAMPWRRWVILLAAVVLSFASALVVVGVLPGQNRDSGSTPEKGPMVLLGKAKAAVVGAACAMLSCAELAGKVRPQDEDWLAHCSEKARKTVAMLGMEDSGIALLDDGANVITHDIGCEVRTGPVEIHPAVSGLANHAWTLAGKIKTGSDGASLQFDTLKLDDGRELPVCAIGVASGAREVYGPGIMKGDMSDPEREPDSKLHARDGFIYVITGRLDVYFAK
jgi:serine/threonine protein kinase